MRNNSAPLGRGKVKHSKKGNAMLTTRTRQGNKVHTWLWLRTFSTSLGMTISQSQLRDGIAYRPIRIDERFLQFSILYPTSKHEWYDKLVGHIRQHWSYDLSQKGSFPAPMTLKVLGANRVYRGWIERASQHVDVTEVIGERQFQMRILTGKDRGAKIVGKLAPYVPYRGTVTDYGPWWYTVKQLDALVSPPSTGKGGKHGSGSGKNGGGDGTGNDPGVIAGGHHYI